jgi:hypothetical protein
MRESLAGWDVFFFADFLLLNFIVKLMDFVVVVKPAGISIEAHISQSPTVLPAAIGKCFYPGS